MMSEAAVRTSGSGSADSLVSKQTTPLIQAIMKQDKSSFKKMVESAAIDASDGDQRTALHWAVMKDEVDFVKAILKRKPNVNALDRRRYSPLHYAAETSNIKLFETLMKSGADHRLVTADDNSILHLAVISKPNKNSPKILKFLLESPNHSLEINKVNKAGETPLCLACCRNNTDAALLFIRARGDCNIADGYALGYFFFISFFLIECS